MSTKTSETTETGNSQADNDLTYAIIDVLRAATVCLMEAGAWFGQNSPSSRKPEHGGVASQRATENEAVRSEMQSKLEQADRMNRSLLEMLETPTPPPETEVVPQTLVASPYMEAINAENVDQPTEGEQEESPG